MIVAYRPVNRWTTLCLEHDSYWLVLLRTFCRSFSGLSPFWLPTKRSGEKRAWKRIGFSYGCISLTYILLIGRSGGFPTAYGQANPHIFFCGNFELLKHSFWKWCMLMTSFRNSWNGIFMVVLYKFPSWWVCPQQYTRTDWYSRNPLSLSAWNCPGAPTGWTLGVASRSLEGTVWMKNRIKKEACCI